MAPRATRLRHQYGGIANRVAAILVCLTLLPLSWATPDSALATGQGEETASACAVTKATYELTICLTAPAPRVPLRTDARISATVEITDPHIDVRSVDFSINERRVLSDFDVPFEFMLPVDYWKNGVYELSASARTSDDERSNPVVTQITIETASTLSFPQAQFTPTTGRPAAEGEPFVVAAVGDSAGGSPESAAVTDLIGSWDPNLLLYLGDVYNSGTYVEYMNWYNPDQFVGRFRDITLPTPGNHEYGGASVPQGYMEYWGDPPHYYSVDTAGWHIVSLDSNPKFDQIFEGSPQLDWLAQDLSASSSACKLVFFHHPPFTVGSYSEEEADLRALWQVLADNNVTLVLTGHDHNYQRWERLDRNGQRHPSGPVPMVVGTGGQSEYRTKVSDDRVAGPIVQEAGALRLELGPNGATTRFVTIDGIVRDTDVIPCDQTRSDTTAPSAPATVTTFREQDGTVTVRWTSVPDDTGVDHFEVYRGDELIANDVHGDSFVDTGAGGIAAPTYRVVAVDRAGSASSPSPDAAASGQPQPDVVFADTFSSGNLGRWQDADGLAVGPYPESPGGSGWIARARGSTHAASALWTASDGPLSDFQVTTSFRILEQGDNPVVFLRLRSPDGDSLMSVNTGANGKLGTYNDVMSAGASSDSALGLATWHDLEVAITGPMGARQVTVLLDGQVVEGLSGPIDLGDAEIGAIQLGDSSRGRVYDVQYSAFSVARATTMPAGTPIATPEATPLMALDTSLIATLPATAWVGLPRPTAIRPTTSPGRPLKNAPDVALPP